LDSKVSVIIGTYNRAELLKRCLESVFSQSYKNIEVIVINDASEDNTLETLHGYKKKFPDKFNWITNKKNMGIAYNSNLAFSISKGDYLALIGDDDEWVDVEKLKKQLLEFSKNKKVGLVSSWWNDVNNAKIVNEHCPIIADNPVEQIMKQNRVYCGSTVLISRSAWESVGGFDENIPKGTDSDLFRNIIVHGYSSLILQDFTTNVYTDVHNRMTPTSSVESLKIHIKSHELCLNKYSELFIIYPSSKRTRKKKLVKTYLRLLKKEMILKNVIKLVRTIFI
jgi:glycosyltransferase involved in cell wall biosynthesis